MHNIDAGGNCYCGCGYNSDGYYHGNEGYVMETFESYEADALREEIERLRIENQVLQGRLNQSMARLAQIQSLSR